MFIPGGGRALETPGRSYTSLFAQHINDIPIHNPDIRSGCAF
jgi:hypothetical protein